MLSAAAQDGGCAVLAVDDYPEHSRMLGALLHEYEVCEVATAAAALRAARTQPFHLYILDFHLPDIDGLQLCRIFKRFDPNTPVLMLSADDIRERSFAAGANAALVKGGDPQRLIDCVAMLTREQARRNDDAYAVEREAIAHEVHLREEAVRSAIVSASRKVEESRRMLDEIRSVRAIAFRRYTEAGGARAGFVEQWPALQRPGS